MPQLIQTIDQIARELQRDVIGIEFHNRKTGYLPNFRNHAERQTIINWLDENDIGYCECGHYASDFIVDGYRGQLYLDIVPEENDLKFQAVTAFLQRSDGTPRFEGAWLRCLPLELAMRNAYHDAPGYWDSVADLI